MKYLVSEIMQFRVNAENPKAAIELVKLGGLNGVKGYSCIEDNAKVQSTMIPYDNWPIWAKTFSKLALSHDKGIGDILARIIGNENSEAFKRWYKVTFGKDCGCDDRQRRWNLMYPLR